MGDTIQFDKPLAHKKKYVEIIELITQKIIDGEIRPGDKLPSEVQFIEQLGISRTPVREALKILESMGVITIKRGEGIYLSRPMDVAKLNPLVFDLMMISNQKDKLVEFRQYFENMLLDMAATSCDEEDIDKLNNHVIKQTDVLETVDAETWAQLDMDFHKIILNSTRNPFMIDIGHTVYELYRNQLPRLTIESRRNTIKTHKIYIQILKESNRDSVDQLKKLIKRNYDTSEE